MCEPMMKKVVGCAICQPPAKSSYANNRYPMTAHRHTHVHTLAHL